MNKIIVTWGEQTFSPINYHSFKTGGITLEVAVPPGADVQQVHREAMAQLQVLAAEQFKRELEVFMANTRAAAAAVSAAKGR